MLVDTITFTNLLITAREACRRNKQIYALTARMLWGKQFAQIDFWNGRVVEFYNCQSGQEVQVSRCELAELIDICRGERKLHPSVYTVINTLGNHPLVCGLPGC
jgi:hypothetical protein